MLTMNACPPWKRAKRPAISNRFLLMLADQKCSRNAGMLDKKRKSLQDTIQRDPNDLGKPQKHVCSHFWSFAKK